MNSQQYHSLLCELAHVADLAGTDAAALLQHGRIDVDGTCALLIHNPGYDADLLQVRLLLGTIPSDQFDLFGKSLLEANHAQASTRVCAFSVFPGSNDAVLTVQMRMQPPVSAQDLWRDLSQLAQQVHGVWQSILAFDPA